jgi:hypothetical protein
VGVTAQICSIVYLSSETVRLSETSLLDLLVTARRKNQRMGVSGLLLHKPGRFIQVLEGPPDALTPLMESIQADARHTAVRVVLSMTVAHRQFPSWSMGYRDASEDAVPAVAGHRRFDDPITASHGEHSRAVWLLEWFRKAGDNRESAPSWPPVS